jgi:hypothetical protein
VIKAFDKRTQRRGSIALLLLILSKRMSDFRFV